MWREMERGGPEVLLRGNQEGIDKVVSEKGFYAFFMESVTIEYLTNRNCDLRQVGTPLDSKSYGIAMPQGIYKATGNAIYSEIFFTYIIVSKHVISTFFWGLFGLNRSATS